MVRNIRSERRTSSGRVSTTVSQAQAPQRLSGRRLASITPVYHCDETNSIKTNESDVDDTAEDDESKDPRVEFKELSGEEECEEEEEEEEEETGENDTIQAGDEGKENESSIINRSARRNEALKRARAGRKFRRKRRRSQKAGNNLEKMNSSINNSLNDTHVSQSTGAMDSLKSQKFVQINHALRILNLCAYDNIECIYDTFGHGSVTSSTSTNSSNRNQHHHQTAPILPIVNIDELQDYQEGTDYFKLTPNYVKFVEKTSEDLDEEIEYDMDEEDNLWLQLINSKRSDDQPEITQEQFEILMDRLEKESYFQAASIDSKTTPHNSPDKSLNNSKQLVNESTSHEDALCCICLDGEGYNSNAILFCDMCNLAVHQECYGVPYIPEGQWLCRRCIQSPSAPVKCILCPNTYGAFKQTDAGLWAHVFCAIWIPEVHFANTVFLEPVIGIENIDRARWKLMCYICRKRNVGACIQCDKANCYTAFHVTCAQQAGLYMSVCEEVVEEEAGRRKKNGKKDQRFRKNSSSNSLGEVRRCAYCDIHTPIEVLSPRTRKAIGVSSTNSTATMTSECEEAMKNAQKARMKKARKILAERRNAPPQVCMPVVPKEKTEDIIGRVEFPDKREFFEKLTSYWLLKRYSRNGVPMLRRLQTMGLKNKRTEINFQIDKKKEDTSEEERTEIYAGLKEQLLYWKKLRQNLEKARLLMELVRKREKLKRELIQVEHLKGIYDINSFNGIFLQRILNLLRELDTSKIFYEPVDIVAAPTYYEIIKQPMDLSRMQKKLNGMEYESLAELEADFFLMVQNCMQFNQKKSYYYNLAVKIREQGSLVLKQARTFIELNEEKHKIAN